MKNAKIELSDAELEIVSAGGNKGNTAIVRRGPTVIRR
jgi:hypothetical protein